MRTVVVFAALVLPACQFEVTGLTIPETDFALGGGADLDGRDGAPAQDLSADQAMPPGPDMAMPSQFLMGQVLPPPAAIVVLTTEGTQDWAHYGLSSTLDFNHRALGGTRIPNFEKLGTPPLGRLTSHPVGFTWTDGTPTLAATDTQAVVYIEELGNGFRWLIACEGVQRVARFYLGGYRARGRLDARFNDGTHTYSDSSQIDANAEFYAVYRIDYRCTGVKSLEVSWRVGEDFSSGGNMADVRVASVTLQ